MRTTERIKGRSRSLRLLAGLFFAGCLTGCGLGMPGEQGTRTGMMPERFSGPECELCTEEISESTAYAGQAEDVGDGPQAECSAADGAADYAPEYAKPADGREALKEQFSRYAPFGLAYDAKNNVLTYNGKRVRCFEDIYPVGDDGGETYGGMDFFDKKGVVDVCAVRDFSGIVRNADGSFDPGGRLTGLRQCSNEEFRARDIKALIHPPVKEAAAVEGGEPASPEELEKIAAEYAPFGVTYDAKTDVWYYKGEKIHVFQDILMSNGETATGGGFSGALRQYCQDGGTVDICTVRDFSVLNAGGYGTLKGIERFVAGK